MELEIGPELVGRKVSNAARLDWGVGTVLRVQAIRVAEAPAHRVSVQFPSGGHRTLIVPPARLIPPPGEVSRAEGWIDKLAGETADDRLRGLPSDVKEFLGLPAQRFTVAASLYRWTDEPAALEKWAREHARVADPLTLWTRDELGAAFADFAAARDNYLREAALAVRRAEGATGVTKLLAKFDEPLRSRLAAALGPAGG